MRYLLLSLILLPVTLLGCGGGHGSSGNTTTPLATIATPPAGMLYQGVFPGDQSGNENDITATGIQQYIQLSGKGLAWVYFSDNWFQGRAFPAATTTMIRNAGAVPYVRLMLRSSADTDVAEPTYTLQNIINGDFDQDLTAWAHAAAQFATPLIVEYGTECNGSWFSWNGVWNGGATVGPQKFIAAYRHIILLMRAAGASNITWVFHVDCGDDPQVSWNALENYYPGDDVIDWIGVSAYGAQTPTDTDPPSAFQDEIDGVYPRLTALAPSKPIIVAEFGCVTGNPQVQADQWAQAALNDLFTHRWPKIMGFSWWNEQWQNDDNPADNSDMTLEDNPALAAVFHTTLATYQGLVQDQPIINTPSLEKMKR